jgi:pyruvate/2-oxoacid:ferredoxin oxidoreductase beta subunit
MKRVVIEEELLSSGHFACPGCGETLAFRHVLKAIGRKVAVVTTAGCGSVVDGYWPVSASKVPFFHCSFGTAAATAAGLKAGLEMIGDRRTTVLAWAGDGGTFDIGLQSLSGAAERNEDILYCCYDNEAYMNTGIQRSSATPKGSWTTTTPIQNLKEEPKKDIDAILVAHRIPYLATASLAFPEDLARKVKKAKAIRGTRFIHLLIPCPPGWRFQPDLTIKLSRLAVASRVFPLYEVEYGMHYQFSPMPEKIPVKEYIRLQGRFSHFGKKMVEALQREVDARWEELLERVRGHEPSCQ